MRPTRHADNNPQRDAIEAKSQTTFIGYRKDGTPKNTATQAEFDIAKQKFHEFFVTNNVKEEDKLGTKLYCYDYEPIEYPDPDGTTTFQLEQSFINKPIRTPSGGMIKRVFAIDPITEYLIDEDTDEGKRIPQAHWDYATKYLEKKDNYAKLYSHRKVDNGLGIRHCFIMLLAAISVDGGVLLTPTIFAMAGNKWKNEHGAFSIHKAITDEQGELFDLKITRKYNSNRSRKYEPTEAKIATMAGMLISHTQKNTTLRQSLFLTKLYKIDFFDFIDRAEREIYAKTSPEKESTVIHYKVQFTKILLQAFIELQKLHELGIIHRDIKPDNIVTDYTSTTKLSTRIIDFGLSILLPDIWKTLYDVRVGTKDYWAPEINDPTKEKVPYTKQSDLWAMGKIFSVLHEMLSRAAPASQQSDLTFGKLFCRLTAKNPDDRPHSAYIQLALLCYLSEIEPNDLDTILSEYHFPIRNVRSATCLNRLFIKAPETAYFSFCNLFWVSLFQMLERNLASADANKKKNAEAILDWYESKTKTSDEVVLTSQLYNQPLFEFSDQWLSAFIERVKKHDIHSEKLVALFWLYKAHRNDLKLCESRVSFPLEALWDNELFWKQLQAHIQAHTIANQQLKNEVEEKIIAFLEKAFNKEAGTLYVRTAADEPQSSLRYGS